VRRVSGDRFVDVELSVLVQCAGVVPDPTATVESLRSVAAGAMTAEQVLRSPFTQLGSSVDEVCDRILELRERHGVSYLSVFDGQSTGFEHVVARLTAR
jgi:hypothetical protein